MKIAMTDRYTFQKYHPCDDLHDCRRNYCKKHRLLWVDCDTMKRGTEGDRDVINGTHTVLELGDCPSCEQEKERGTPWQG